jgi:hypothetical protein
MNPFERAARTFLQAFLASFVLFLGSVAVGKLPAADALYAAVASAIFAGLSATLSALQNMLEDQGAIPVVLGKDKEVV